MSILFNRYRHKKRNSLYTVLFEGRMKVEGEWKDSIVYQDDLWRVFTREKEEFFDGRFELVKDNS